MTICEAEMKNRIRQFVLLDLRVSKRENECRLDGYVVLCVILAKYKAITIVPFLFKRTGI